MNHKQKRKVATKMNVVTKIDVKTGEIKRIISTTNIFNSKAWNLRKEEISNKVKNRESRAKWLSKMKKDQKMIKPLSINKSV